MIKPNFPLNFYHIKKYVMGVGSSNVALFGGEKEGGYYIQQIPDEITAFIIYLLDNKANHFENYLEIGSASGGFTRLLSDFIQLDNVYIIDNNGWPTYRVRPLLLKDLNVTEFIGDSHGTPCRKALRQWGKKFDLIHIDGDHSYDGVMQDTFIAKDFLKDGGYIVYHDVEGVPEVKRWYHDLLSGAMPEFKHVNTIINPQLPRCGIGLFQFHFDPMRH